MAYDEDDDTCPRCGGTGEIDDDDNEAEEGDVIDCPECDGTGVVDTEDSDADADADDDDMFDLMDDE